MSDRSAQPIWIGVDSRRWHHFRVDNQLLVDPRLDHLHLAVYCALACHAETASGDCYPSIDTIARYVKAGRRTVMERVDDLCSTGYIEVRSEPGKANRYRLLECPTLPASVLAQISAGDRRLVHAPVVKAPPTDALPLEWSEDEAPPASGDEAAEFVATVERANAYLAGLVKAQTGRAPKVTKEWVRAMSLLMRRGPTEWEHPEQVSYEEVCALLDFTFTVLAAPGSDGFCWADQVRSPTALRRHWVKLAQVRKQRTNGGNHTSVISSDRIMGPGRAEEREAANADVIRRVAERRAAARRG